MGKVLNLFVEQYDIIIGDENMKTNFIPKTRISKWSVGLIISLLLIIGLFFLFVTLGQRGGDTFFDNLILAIPGLLGGIAGIASFFTGIIGIIKYKERSILVYLSTTIGFLVLVYILSEILIPH